MNGWGMVSSPNSIFPVIFFFLMEAGEKEKRKNSAVTFSVSLILKSNSHGGTLGCPGWARPGAFLPQPPVE